MADNHHMLNLEGVRGLLIDVDGTLLVHDRAVRGAAEAIERRRSPGIPFRITTNTFFELALGEMGPDIVLASVAEIG